MPRRQTTATRCDPSDFNEESFGQKTTVVPHLLCDQLSLSATGRKQALIDCLLEHQARHSTGAASSPLPPSSASGSTHATQVSSPAQLNRRLTWPTLSRSCRSCKSRLQPCDQLRNQAILLQSGIGHPPQHMSRATSSGQPLRLLRCQEPSFSIAGLCSTLPTPTSARFRWIRDVQPQVHC